jgi:hypothetical protein
MPGPTSTTTVVVLGGNPILPAEEGLKVEIPKDMAERYVALRVTVTAGLPSGEMVTSDRPDFAPPSRWRRVKGWLRKIRGTP